MTNISVANIINTVFPLDDIFFLLLVLVDFSVFAVDTGMIFFVVGTVVVVVVAVGTVFFCRWDCGCCCC